MLIAAKWINKVVNKYYSTWKQELPIILRIGYHLQKKMIIDNNNNITVDIMNTALDKNIVTESLLNLCKNIFDKRETYDLPWSPKIRDAKRFAENNGPVSYGPVKVPGVYILHVPDIELTHSYVGQSVNLGVRIRNHLHLTSKSTITIIKTLKQTQKGSVETCIINNDTVHLLTTKHGISINDFLNILEQYVILVTMPSLNTLYLIRDFGVSSPCEGDRALRHTNRQPLYIYRVLKE